MALGQAGVRLRFVDTVVYIDPYLTDFVADTCGRELKRLTPPPLLPSDVTDAAWVLITHAHPDHADPTTLQPLAAASPEARFMCTPPTAAILDAIDVRPSRVVVADSEWRPLSPAVSVRAIPAAHTNIERDECGHFSYVGYLLRADGRLLYHAGDTMPHQEIFDALRAEGRIDLALLPVNERNYFRDAQGIVGNMSVREAFMMARQIGAAAVVPIHWDLFEPNSTSKAEIQLLYSLMQPGFELRLCESGECRGLW